MNDLNFIFRVYTDEIYFFTFILFLNFRLGDIRLKAAFFFSQLAILCNQMSGLCIFPLHFIVLFFTPIIFLLFIHSSYLKQTLFIGIQFTVFHSILSIFILILLFFMDSSSTMPFSFYEEFFDSNISYYSLNRIFSSCTASIFFLVWLIYSHQRHKKNSFDPMLYLALEGIAAAIFLLTCLFLYESEAITVEAIVLASILFLVFTLLILFWIFNQMTIVIQNQMLLERQLHKQTSEYRYSKAISDSLAKLAKLRHDLKNDLIILQQYLLDKDIASASSFLSEMFDICSSSSQIIVTGSPSISAILNAKQEICRQYKISFDVSFQFETIFTLSDLDLASLFGNLLDNAITASKTVPEAKRSISLSIMQVDSYLWITCKNSFDGTIRKSSKGLLSTKCPNKNILHGLGLSIMTKIVTQNNGSLHYYYTNSVFTVEIMLPNYE